MDVQLPDWWDYPARCEQGHLWGPNPVIVSWMHCHCPGGGGSRSGTRPAGHQVVSCRLKAAGRAGAGRGT
jgi:hypothetical protein